MERAQILEGLKEIFTTIRPSIDTTSISEQTLLGQDLGLDSLTMLLMSLAIETKFNFKFEGMPVLNTVGDAIDFIGEHTK